MDDNKLALSDDERPAGEKSQGQRLGSPKETNGVIGAVGTQQIPQGDDIMSRYFFLKHF